MHVYFYEDFWTVLLRPICKTGTVKRKILGESIVKKQNKGSR